jgi:hypothetical protein
LFSQELALLEDAHMESKSISRKEFLTLTLTLVGTAAAVGCGSSSSTPIDAGRGGAGGGAGAGGAGGGAGGSTGADAAAGAGGDASVAACTDPLPETQLPDTNGHTHTVTIHPSQLDSTTAIAVTTSAVPDLAGVVHSHMVPLTAAMLAQLKSGGTVTAPSLVADGHIHTYSISCT